MSSGPPDPTIGIITALPKEYAAALAMLEQPIEPAAGNRSRRKYAVGEIPSYDGGRHRVALALLPTMGNSSAAARATLLLENFPSIDQLLMVGIAGGAPRPDRANEHVRLGDVVVSGAHGVVQYDYVAETIDGPEPRHLPRPPSAALLEAVRLLEAGELAGQRPWLSHFARTDHIRDARRPADSTDILTTGTSDPAPIPHPDDPARRPGEPRIFVGTIGSANVLLKDPARRDSMIRKHNIRAFEMEGSGIADAVWGLEVGYLVIRGICDYCDARKNDLWQGHAAVVAAAYTRALLESMPASTRRVLVSHDPSQISAFVQQTVELFQFMHYEVERDRSFAGRVAPIFLTGTLGDAVIYRLIDCWPLPGTVAALDRFAATLRMARREFPGVTGTIVVGAQPPEELVRPATEEGISFVSLDQLDAQLVDGRAYARALRDRLRSHELYQPSTYIEPLVTLGETIDQQPCNDVLDEWLAEPNWNQLTLLGDMGTGKTFLTHMLALRMAEAYLASPLTHPLPVLIDLRNADRQFSLEGLISTHFQQRGLGRISFSAFEHALARGRAVLLLDGFDEMASRVAPQVTGRNFDELVKCIRGRAKVLLTCRTHYFRDSTDEREVVHRGREYDNESARELYWDLIARKGFRIAYIQPFDRDQIKAYLQCVRPDGVAEAMALFEETYDVLDLASRPILLKLIVASIDRLKGKTINAAVLYQLVTDVWLERDKWRHVLLPEVKERVLTSLARRLWQNGVAQLHHGELRDHVVAEVGPLRAADVQQLTTEIDIEMRTATFLTRNPQGDYRFAHKSHAEFLVARDIARALAHKELDRLRVKRRLGPEQLSFFAELVVDAAHIDGLLAATLVADYQPDLSENALLCLYALRSQKAVSRAARTGTIALPDDMKLAGATLTGVRLAGASLRGANLVGARLDDCDLRQCSFVNADLSHADMRRSSLGHADLSRAVCAHSYLDGADLSHAVTSSTDFTSASLTDAVLTSDMEAKLMATAAAIRARSASGDNFVKSVLPLVRASISRFAQGSLAEADRDDLVQQVMLRLLARGASLQMDPQYLEKYVRSVCLHTFFDYRRSKVRQDRWHSDVALEVVSAEVSDRDMHGSGEELQRALESLDPELRMITVLRFREDLSWDEIGRALGITPDVARMRVMRIAMPRLRKALDREDT